MSCVLEMCFIMNWFLGERRNISETVFYICSLLNVVQAVNSEFIWKYGNRLAKVYDGRSEGRTRTHSDSYSSLAFLGSEMKCDPSLKLFQ